MTTADGMYPVFSGRRPNLFIISDHDRVVTEIAEVLPPSHEVFLSALYSSYLKTHPHIVVTGFAGPNMHGLRPSNCPSVLLTKLDLFESEIDFNLRTFLV